MIFVNTFRASVYVHNEQRTLMPYLSSLFKSMMIKSIDDSNGMNNPEGSGAPGALSPPTRTENPKNEDHKVVQLKAMGWKGASQLNCSECRKKTSYCCSKCSTVHSVVALCQEHYKFAQKDVKKLCARAHRRAPDEAKRSSACLKPKKGTKRRREDDEDGN